MAGGGSYSKRRRQHHTSPCSSGVGRTNRRRKMGGTGREGNLKDTEFRESRKKHFSGLERKLARKQERLEAIAALVVKMKGDERKTFVAEGKVPPRMLVRVEVPEGEEYYDYKTRRRERKMVAKKGRPPAVSRYPEGQPIPREAIIHLETNGLI